MNVIDRLCAWWLRRNGYMIVKIVNPKPIFRGMAMVFEPEDTVLRPIRKDRTR